MKKLLSSRLSATAKCAFTALFLVPNAAHAYYYNEAVCAFSAPSRIAPGEVFTLAVNVSANRTEPVNIPVSFYYSNSQGVDGSSVLMGTTTVPLDFPGNYCSSTKQVTLQMPTSSKGMSCFIPNQSYIVAKVGDDEYAWTFQPKDGNALPQISSVSPTEGRPGSLIHVLGENIDAYTGVRLAQEPLAQAIINNEVIGVVGENSESGVLSLKDNFNNYCVPPLSTGPTFTVLEKAQYCDSGAIVEGFGRISQVAMNGFNNALTSTSTCPTYNDYSSFIGLTQQGNPSEDLYFQLNSCGEPAYDRLMKIFIDWNNDADFDDQGELVLAAPYLDVDTLYRLNLAIPSTAKAGTTKMRIVNALYYSGYVESLNDLGACGFYPYGETQDYGIDLVPTDFGLSAYLTETGQVLSAASLGSVINAKHNTANENSATKEQSDLHQGKLLDESGNVVEMKSTGLRLR